MERRSPTGIAARQRCEREEPRTPARRPSQRSPHQQGWHRPSGNADLWPVLPVGAGIAAPRAAKAAYRQPARSARDNGAPVSDRHRSATALRKGRTPNSRTTPLSAQSPVAEIAPPVRERRPLASSPGAGRHRGPQGRESRVPPTRWHRPSGSAGLRPASQRDSAAKGKNPELPHRAPLGAVPSSRDGTARLGTPVFRPAPLPRGERTTQPHSPSPRTAGHNPHPRRHPCKAPSPPSSCSRAKPKKP